MNRNGWSDTQLMTAMAQAIACFDRNEPYKTRENMKKAGFVFLSSGAFGAAYTRPDIDGYVIKASDGRDSFPAYVYWAMANPMECVPEYRYAAFSEPSEFDEARKQFMVMMPRYAACTEELDRSEDYAACQGIIWGYTNREKNDFGYRPFNPDSPFQVATMALREFFGDSVGYDFHRGNIMWDGYKRNFVITDPICDGNTDELIASITGKHKGEEVIPHQFDLQLLGMGADRVWPRPVYADRVAPVQITAGLRELSSVGRGPVGIKARQPAKLQHDGKQWDNLNKVWRTVVRKREIPRLDGGLRFNPDMLFVDFGSVENRLAHLGPIKRSMGLKPVMVAGRQATGAELAEIGKRLQGKDLMAMFRAGEKEIRFAFMPSIPPFLKFGALPDQKVEVRECTLSLAQAEFLQGQYKVGKLNLDQKNFGKGWQPPILNL